jgi:type II secretory pathway predicted ATPase ExeA
MYYEYWGMQKAPFDNVPDPSMYVESHSAVENAIAETLFAIEEGNECIAVIVGDVGSGKTLSLRLILDSLQQDKYRIAFITNPDMSFVHLLREIIGQITGQECEVKLKVELLEHFNKLLFETHDEGKKVLIFVDEANALTPPNLESLRLLTNMQDDTQNLFTMVLAGQMELAKRLEHPKRANLFQRIGTYNRIGKIESVEKLKDYVATRIQLAGGKQMVFSDTAIEALWKHSEHGVPRLVNKICKLCLKAGETNSFQAIDGEIVSQVGERFQKQMGPAERREERARKAAKEQVTGKRVASATVRRIPEEKEESHVVSQLRAIGPRIAEQAIVPEETDDSKVGGFVQTTEPEPLEEIPVTEEKDNSHVVSPLRAIGPKATEEYQYYPEAKETSWETDIGPFRVKIAIPSDILQQAGASSSETRAKIAGSLAAQTLQRYPQMAFSSSHDPVALWGDITKSILNAFEQHAMASGQ